MQSSQQKPKINVIYATQTGTAYDLAKQFVLLHNSNLLINKFVDIASIEQFQQTESQCLWIFFIATTGQGDFPYSMRALWKKMLSKAHPSLSWMKFTIYSFGDRSYGDNFCMAARKFRQRLIGLQAQQVVQIGLGDQQQANGYLQEYRDKWYPNLYNYLMQNSFLLKTNQSLTPKGTQTKVQKQNFSQKHKHDYDLKILQTSQICSNKDRRIFMTSIELMNYPQKIVLGDILSISPHNNPQDVSYLMNHFNIDQTDTYDDSAQIITYKQLFTSHLNISFTLNHSFFISRSDIPKLSSYCQNQLFRQKLIQLENDYDQYHNYIKKYKRNVVEVIKDFQLEKLPIKDFVKRCGGIIQRKYSIAHVVENEGRKIAQVIYKLVKHKINQNRIHDGLCSHDMAVRAEIGALRKGNILKGDFQYTEKPINNFIFISLGTGIAPFMQYFDLAKHSTNQWNIQVYFTNRYQNQVYFQSQLQDLVADNKMNPFLSFTGQGGKRIVRLVEENINFIEEMIEKCGLDQIKIMICGPKQMCEGLQNIMARELGLDIKQLKKKKILVYENW